MSILAAFVREVRDTENALADVPDVIHVTPDALQGSVVTVLARYDHDEGSLERREIRVHPEDWRDLLVEKDAFGAYVVGGNVEHVLGIRVVGG